MWARLLRNRRFGFRKPFGLLQSLFIPGRWPWKGAMTHMPTVGRTKVQWGCKHADGSEKWTLPVLVLQPRAE